MFIACDESASDKHFVVGSIWFPIGELSTFEKKVHDLRLKHGYWREIHLTKLKKKGDRMHEFYEEFLTLAFAIPNIRYSFIIGDKNRETDERYHDGNAVKRNLVFLYLVLSRRYNWWKVAESPYIIFDEMANDPTDHHCDCCEAETEEPPLGIVKREDIPETREFIEKYIGKKVICFSPCKSHISSPVQLADLLTGLVALRTKIDVEKKPIEDINPAKLSLLSFVEEHLKVNLSHPTAPWTEPVNIWMHVPSKR